MWVILPIVSILICAVAGNISSGNILSPAESTAQNASGSEKSIDELAEAWEGQLETGRNKRYIDESSLDEERFISKKGDTVSVVESRESVPAKEKSVLFGPWGGKRINVYRSGQKIRRPIRVPFNSWGGKRRDEGQFLADRKTRYEGVDVKRIVNRVPFNSWGGKRSEGGPAIYGINPLDDGMEMDHWFDKARLENENPEEKRALPTKLNKTPIKFNSWGGKRSNDEYHLSTALDTLARKDEEKGEEEDDDNDWLREHDKRSSSNRERRPDRNPWPDKRKTEEIVLFAVDASKFSPGSVGVRKVFYPWGG